MGRRGVNMNMNIFDEWSALNDVPFDWRSRFDILREKMPKCKSKEEVVDLLKKEHFYSRYSIVPDIQEEE
jgi:hypothetical protein